MHRLLDTKLRYDGFSNNVSIRALIVRAPNLSSLAHDGINPQRIALTIRLPLSINIGELCVGAML
jgi:hypothetical protein